MFLDEFLEVSNFSFELEDKNIFSNHVVKFDTSNFLCIQLNKIYKKINFNFYLDKENNEKVELEIWADDELVGSYVSLSDKKFSIECFVDYCQDLKILTRSKDKINIYIYDGLLIENAKDHISIPLVRNKIDRSIQRFDEALIICADSTKVDRLSNALKFLKEYGKLQTYYIVVINKNNSSEISDITSEYNVINLPYYTDSNIYSLLLCLPQIVRAKKYLFLSPDTLVVDNLSDSTRLIKENKFYFTREQSLNKHSVFGSFIDSNTEFPYYGSKEDLIFLEVDDNKYNSPYVINGGFFVANLFTYLALENYIRNHEENFNKYFKNHKDNEYSIFALINSALISCDMGAELLPEYSIQLQNDDCQISLEDNILSFYYNNRKAKILYFNGPNSNYKYNKLKNYSLNWFNSKSISAPEIGPQTNLQLTLNGPLITTEECIFTIARAGDEEYLESLLFSARYYGKIQNLYVINVDFSQSISLIITKYFYSQILCKLNQEVYGDAYKLLIFDIVNMVKSEHYIYLDVNSFVLDDIGYLMDLTYFYHGNIILSANKYKNEKINNLKSLLMRMFYVDPIKFLLDHKLRDNIMNMHGILDTNVIAGDYESFLKINNSIKSLASSLKHWVMKTSNGYHFLLNYVIKLNYYMVIDQEYNFSLFHNYRLNAWKSGKYIKAEYLNKPVRVVNFQYCLPKIKKFFYLFKDLIFLGDGSEWELFLRMLNNYFDFSSNTNILNNIYPKTKYSYPKYLLNDIESYFLFIKNIIESSNPKKILEIGFGPGVFTAALSLFSSEDAEIFTIEEEANIEHIPFLWLVPKKYLNKIKINKNYIDFCLNPLIRDKKKFDLILINGDRETHEIYNLMINSRKLLPAGAPIILHSPGKNYENINFIYEKLHEEGYAVSKFAPRQSEDLINWVLCTDDKIIKKEPKLTILVYLSDDNKIFVDYFIKSMLINEYPKDKITILAVTSINNTYCKTHIETIRHQYNIEYVENLPSEESAWQEGLKYYLKNHTDKNMMIWRSNLMIDKNFINSMVMSNQQIVQPLLSRADKAEVTANLYVRSVNTAFHLTPSDIAQVNYIDWIQSAPVYAVRQKWSLFWRLGGFKHVNLFTECGLEGWVYKVLQEKYYLSKNAVAWNINDNNIGYKAIISGDSIKFYQKKF